MLENVRRIIGDRSRCEMPGDQSLMKYSKLLPEILLKEWREEGMCAFGNGLLWLVLPDAFEEIAAMWGGEEPAPQCIARTAFGDLFVWDEAQGVRYLDVVYDNVHDLGYDIEDVFSNVICREDFRADLLRQPIFEQARMRLGTLSKDEVYGFEPAPSLGGSGTPETLRKVKLREYLTLLNSLR